LLQVYKYKERCGILSLNKPAGSCYGSAWIELLCCFNESLLAVSISSHLFHSPSLFLLSAFLCCFKCSNAYKWRSIASRLLCGDSDSPRD